MKLELDIDAKTMAVEFNFADGSAQLKHADQVYEAKISEPEPSLFVVLLNNRVYRCTPEHNPTGAAEVIVNGQRIPITVRDKKHLRSGAGASANAGSPRPVRPTGWLPQCQPGWASSSTAAGLDRRAS